MSIETVVHGAFAAIERGAALVYHDVLAAEAQVTAWETSDPVVGALVENGVAYAKSALMRFGVPVEAISIVGDDIMAALKALAAQDATVPSAPVAAVTVLSEQAISDHPTAGADVAAFLAPPVPPAAPAGAVS